MARYILELEEKDIIRILVERYGVELKNVTVTVIPPYDGGPTDRSPGGMKVSIQNPKKAYDSDKS